MPNYVVALKSSEGLKSMVVSTDDEVDTSNLPWHKVGGTVYLQVGSASFQRDDVVAVVAREDYVQGNV